ncbi:MAG: OmpA family protein [Prevotella sp.]|nr:OmpA family protein [Bacteroides sp.]MCM1365651.1 OmpA family protein [Prevotella sp.]
MKNRLKKIYRTLVFAVIAASSFYGLESNAQNPLSQQRIENLDDLSFLEMLNTPELGSQSEKISTFQKKEGQGVLLKQNKYKEKGVTVELTRNKEVLLVTIPAALLFDPNEIELSEKAGAYLDPIKRYLRQPDMYRVLLAMHTDNTGSPQYRDMITEERVDAIFDYFDKSNVDTRYMFSYALSDDLPLTENNSVLNREKNRRLEIYLVPGEKMLEQAKKGRIAF